MKIQVDDSKEMSIAQIQNGFSCNHPDDIPANWEESYVEKPVNLEIFDKSVTVENNFGHVTIFADGVKEYERINDKLLITLMATTGELGKLKLAWRPGRASGDTTNEGHIMMPTPLAQELGENEWTFAFKISTGTFDEMKTAKYAYERLTPSISYQKQALNVFINRLDNKIWPLEEKIDLEKEFSMLGLPRELLVSAIYPSYRKKDAFVVRLANPTKKSVTIDKKILTDVKIVNALEEEIVYTEEIQPYDYITLQMTP
ncbi:hypothetical protein [Enterococcus ureasiticus]|uniref:hypothetical protein n=1 Tax=Enterococcus ureasiticus TaxID=903984 RepID=UPI001F5FEC68|nr:hypothetical protein [Enterococcus ureasiticus]